MARGKNRTENAGAVATAEEPKATRIRLNLPTPSDAELESFIGTGEQGEANRRAAVVEALNRARTTAAKRAARKAGIEDVQAFVNSPDFATAIANLKFGKRASKGAKTGGRKVKRKAEDLQNALATLGTVPTDPEAQKEYLRNLLASMNVELDEGGSEKSKSE